MCLQTQELLETKTKIFFKKCAIKINLSLKTWSCVLLFVCRTGNDGNIIYSQFL